MRNLYGPTINKADYALAIGKGGTGEMDITKVPDALSLVKNSAKGQPLGPIALDSTGKVDSAKLPVVAGTNNVNINGNFKVAISQTLTWTITDYDSFKTYTIAATAGTISRAADVVTYVAPASAGAVTVTIAGRALTVTVVATLPSQPSITFPSNGASNVSTAATYTSSAFAYTGTADTHASSDWQLSTDANFGTIVASLTASTTNKTTWTPTGLSLSTLYYARVRYNGASGQTSAWSNAVSFTTSTTSIPNHEEAKLVASDKAASDYFGYSVALSSDGTRVVIGAGGKTGTAANQGVVYVFSRSGTTWTQEAKIVASDPVHDDVFGCFVGITSDGTRVVIGAYNKTGSFASQGAAYVFSRSGTTWTQEAKLVASDPAASDNFGTSVSITADGTRIVVGAPQKTGTGSVTNQGAAYIFLRTGTSWAQEAKLLVGDPVANDYFGYATTIDSDGTRVAIGAYLKTGTGGTSQGAVYIFLRTGTSWTQEAKLVAGDPTASMAFGFSVSGSSDSSRIAIGSYLKNSGFSNQGAAYIFLRTGTSWAQEAKLVASDAAASDNFGNKIAMAASGSRIVVGAIHKTGTGGTNQGAAYLYSRSGVTWTQEAKVIASDGAQGDQFAWSVGISGDSTRVAVGAAFNSPSSVTNAGAVYIES